MHLVDFFDRVITTGDGWFCLAYSKLADSEEDTYKNWQEVFYRWPDNKAEIVAHIRELGNHYNIYFSPYLFSEKRSEKRYVLPSRTIVADLDGANVLTLPLAPTVLVETSADRHQGYWILDPDLVCAFCHKERGKGLGTCECKGPPQLTDKNIISGIDEHEKLSRKMSYIIPMCDKNGWFAGKKVRVPETMNLKYMSGAQYIRVVNAIERTYKRGEIEDLPSVESVYGSDPRILELIDENAEWLERAKAIDIGPHEMLASIRHSLPSRVFAQYQNVAPDRSAALWGLTTALFRAGLDRERVWYLAWHSKNNKFLDLRYGADLALARDVMRAELDMKVRLPDVKAEIAHARKLHKEEYIQYDHIAKTVRDHMEKCGSFIHTNDDGAWYVRHDTGKAMTVGLRSQPINQFLDIIFGINASEKLSMYVNNALGAYVSEMPITGRLSTLSYFDVETHQFYLYTGRKSIFKVDSTKIERVNNGYAGIVFPYIPGSAAIEPNYKDLERPWEDELFEGCLDNLTGIEPKYAKAILKSWLISVLMRDALTARPILALIGTQGSGKSTMFRRIYTLLYGRDRAVNAVTNETNFDMAVSTDPLVVLDNVDTAARWLPDRLAVSAASSDIIKRKLYSDNDVVILRRQAMLGLTAHNPKFGREDVVDRFLLLQFERLKKFRSETEILDRIFKMRNALWGAILNDILRVLQTPMPQSGYPQFRVEDFSKFGYWVATALGSADDFARGIDTIRGEQKSFTIDEDSMLVEALLRYVDANPEKAWEDYKTAGQLWAQFQKYASDLNSFQRKYGSPQAMGKKLGTLQDALRQILEVESRYNGSKGSKEWAFRRLKTE